MPICASASLASPVACAASATRRTKTLQRHVERLLLDAGGLCGEAQLQQGLDADPDLACGLADGIDCAERAVDQRREAAEVATPASAPPSVRMPVRNSSAWRRGP
jgi:hypothetical protein